VVVASSSGGMNRRGRHRPIGAEVVATELGPICDGGRQLRRGSQDLVPARLGMRRGGRG